MNRAPRFRSARLLALVLSAGVAFADAVRGEEMSGAFLVRSWQSEDGLPGSIVRSVAQAVDGYLWVATAEGLVRFDGVRFTGFEAEPDATLARVPPRAVFALNDGDVWVATARGGLLRWHGGRLARVWQEADAAVPAAQVVEVSQVVGDGSGGAYIARGAELWRAADPVPQLAERTPEVDGLLRSDAALSSRRSSAGMGARMHDRRGRVWAAEADGLSVADAEGRTERVALPMVETNRINELLEDREGSVWVATGESGLRQIRERRVEVLTTADGLSDRAVGVVMEDRAGAWWLGGKRGGLDRRDGGGVRHFDVGDGSENRPVSAIFEGRVSGMWAATRNGSVFRLEKGLFAPVAGMPGKVIAMAEDAAGRLWFGGSQGVAVWSGGTLTRFGAEEGFTGGEVTALASDAAGALWVGTGGGQVFRGRNGRFENIAAVQRAVSTMLPDADGSLWVTTLGSGLWHWRRGAPAHFAAGEGLPDSRLTCALDDGAGHLWLGSLGGIFRVEKAALAQIEARKSTAAHWLQFDRSDGLLTRECTGGFQPAGWRGRSGELWFPTVNGVVRIQPAALALNAAPPPVVIEECRADGRVLSIGGAAPRIGPGRPRMEFRYTGLSFAAPEKVRFRLRLEGLEDEWRDAGAARTAAYEAVPPGRYRFQVRAANSDGVWNEAGASVAFEVLPFFWETAWFRAAAVLAGVVIAAAVGSAIMRGQMKRRIARIELQRAREAERSRIARDLHDDLGASLTEISMLANLAIEERDTADSTRAPLTQIAGKAHALVSALDEIVWAVNPRHDTLASLADYLAAFAAEFLAPSGIELRLDVARELPPIALDSARRHSLFLALREALNNAVKHSGAREVWLRLKVEDGWIELRIEDRGRGFSPAAPSSGEGLRNLRERLIALGGECRIESIEGAGTRVCLRLPTSTP